MQQDMRYIYEVWQEGSFSKAAEKLYMTQPALSIAIQKIEKNIGMYIFDRTKRPLELTPAGEAYLRTIKQTMYLEQELENELADIKNLEHGKLCIGGSHYINSYILPDILSGFSKKYPGIKLELLESSSATFAKMLDEHEIDLTFNCNPRFMQDFERYPAFFDTVLLAVPADDPINKSIEEASPDTALTAIDVIQGRHLDEDCPMIPLETFKNLPFILLTEGNNLYDRSISLFKEAGFEPEIKLKISQLVTAYHLAESSFAATFISDRLVQTSSDKLRFYKLNSQLIKRMFYILLPKRQYTSFACKAFIDYALNALKWDREI